MGKKVYMMVGIELPEDMTKTRLREYIKRAIHCERGNYAPEDDFFNINVNSLSIVHVSNKMKQLLLYGLRYKNKTFVKG